MINPQDYLILLVEDDDELRKRFVSLLKNRGFKRVIQACDGSELLQTATILRGIENLVIVSDTLMENGEGDKICRSLLEKYPQEFSRTMMIGMSNNPYNEEYWKDVGNWQTFIYKADDIADISSPKNLARLVFNRINSIVSQPQFYVLPNGTYRRSIFEKNFRSHNPRE